MLAFYSDIVYNEAVLVVIDDHIVSVCAEICARNPWESFYETVGPFRAHDLDSRNGIRL